MPTPQEDSVDLSVSGFAWTPPTAVDAHSCWWNQEVYFDGKPTRRRDVWAKLEQTRGITEVAVRQILDTSRVVCGIVAFGDDPATDPAKKSGPFDSGNREFLKADKEHQGVHDALEVGKKVPGKKLQAAHDHFKAGEKFHSQWAKDASTPDGKPKPGEEFAHKLATGEAERYGKMRGTVAKALKVKAVRDKEKAWSKATPTHDATYQKVKAGAKVSREELEAAHEHFKTGGDQAGAKLQKMAGKDGQSLHDIPHDEYMKHMNGVLEHGVKQDVLKGAIDKHDAEEAEKSKPKPEVKPEAADPKVDPKPEAQVAEEKPMPDHEVRQKLKTAFDSAKAVDGHVGHMKDFYEEAKKEVPGLTKQDFHKHVGALEKNGHLELHEHPAPHRLSPEDASHGITSGSGLKYYAVSHTGETPWARGEHDSGADAAHRSIESGQANHSPPSRSDVFAAIAGHSQMPSLSAGAAAREVHSHMVNGKSLSRDNVREIVAKHGSEKEQARQKKHMESIGKIGTNHAAGAVLASMMEEKTGRSSARLGDLSREHLPSHEEVAKRIQSFTGGRLAGRGAAKAAKAVIKHALWHGFDFMSGHDFKGVLDKYSKHDWRHSSPEDVAHAAAAGEKIHPKRLRQAQEAAAKDHLRADKSRHALLEKYGYDATKMTPAHKKRYGKIMSRYAASGGHIDAMADALSRHGQGKNKNKSKSSGVGFDDSEGADGGHWITIAGAAGTTHICIDADGNISKGPAGLTGRPAKEALSETHHGAIDAAQKKAQEKKGDSRAGSGDKGDVKKSSHASGVAASIMDNPALKSLLKPSKFFGMFGPLTGVTYNVWTKYKDKTGEKIAKALGYDGNPKIASSEEMDKLQEKGSTMSYRATPDASQHEGFRKGNLWVGTGLHGSGTYAAYVDPSENGKFKDANAGKAATEMYGSHVARMALSPKSKVVTEDDLEAERSKESEKLADDFRSGKINKGEYKSIQKIIADNGRYAMLKGYDAITVPHKGYMVILNRAATTVQDKDV